MPELSEEVFEVLVEGSARLGLFVAVDEMELELVEQLFEVAFSCF